MSGIVAADDGRCPAQRQADRPHLDGHARVMVIAVAALELSARNALGDFGDIGEYFPGDGHRRIDHEFVDELHGAGSFVSTGAFVPPGSSAYDWIFYPTMCMEVHGHAEQGRCSVPHRAGGPDARVRPPL